jgi:hypothetical protein
VKILTSARDFRSKIATDSSDDDLGLLGGEPLEGSGFEAQNPEPNFEFDWSRPTVPPEGGDE